MLNLNVEQSHHKVKIKSAKCIHLKQQISEIEIALDTNMLKYRQKNDI